MIPRPSHFLTPFDYPIMLEMPHRRTDIRSWHEHIPFAFTLVAMLRPSCILELGTHKGDSFCALCQAVATLELTTACYAVDTWCGDEQAGYYGPEIGAELKAYHDPLYGHFSRLIPSTFDDALNHFSDQSIDLLHIDGLHTYEAVKHDFETWLPKMSPEGVVLLHDINVREHNFGVWRFWDELCHQFPTRSFRFGHGLGIVGVGSQLQDLIKELFALEADQWKVIEKLFFVLGNRVSNFSAQEAASAETDSIRSSHEDLEREVTSLKEALNATREQQAITAAELSQSNAELSRVNAELSKSNAELSRSQQTREELTSRLASTEDELQCVKQDLALLNDRLISSEEVLNEVWNSWSWKLTKPLRLLLHLVERNVARFRRAKDLLHLLTIYRILRYRLIDSSYYREQYPDIAKSGMHPILHYFLWGAVEGRSPHPLFDGTWYLKSYPDVATAQVNPFVNYLRYGAREGRNPHPVFDGAWYYDNNPDVRQSGMNPLFHYLAYGHREGRDPAAWFSSKYYLESNPDVADAGGDPFTHYMRYGRTEGRSPHPENQSQSSSVLLQMLPSRLEENSPIPACCRVDIIIPVYRGLAETRRCIESVLQADNIIPSRVVVIDDHTPDQDVREFLDTLQSREGVILLRHEENLGFVASVNQGIGLSNDHDVVLLNSDTEVAPFWLDRLAAHAYSGPRIGTVTPFSNNATICSYPTMQGTVALPPGEDVASIDKAFREANRGRSIAIPTAVGFCMFIRRECLTEVGNFDEHTFGKGYGEENDFCMRATKLGWSHILAGDTFVYHRGEISFGESSSPAKTKASSIIRHLYPHYEQEIRGFVRSDPASPMRVAATAARFRLGAKPVVLMVTHQLGGGTEKHLQDLLSRLNGLVRVLILRPCHPGTSAYGMEFTSADPGDGLSITFMPASVSIVAEFLRSFGIDRVHIHHLIGMPQELQQILRSLEVPFDFTIHDYFSICPRINLVDSEGKPCNEPIESQCNQCLAVEPVAGNGDIVWWRARHSWLFLDAERVICPSVDVAKRVRRYYPDAHTVIAYHDSPVPVESRHSVALPELPPGGVLRVAVLGALSAQKGASQLLNMVKLVKDHNLPMHFRLIGSCDQDGQCDLAQYLDRTGPYSDDKLQTLISDFDPHLILYPTIASETYCYTLTAGLKSRRPLLVTSVGALPERVASQPWCWIYRHTLSADDLLKDILRIRTEFLERRIVPPVISSNNITDDLATISRDFYQSEYLAPLDSDSAPHAIEQTGKRLKILAVVETPFGTMPSPCAYIRIILPFLHASLRDHLTVRFVKPDDIVKYQADILVTHRIAISSTETVDKAIEHCRKVGMKLIYDLDDELLALPEEHLEAKVFEKQKANVLRLLVLADRVWTSTPALAERVRPWARRVSVIPNALDSRIWTFPNEIRESNPGQAVKILYMGVPTHTNDFNMVKAALKRLCRDLGTMVSVHLIGAVPLSKDIKPFQRILIPKVAAESYPAFVLWLLGHRDFDIGIAPLVDNTFNQSKSPIKVLDYAALGLVTVASDVPCYREVIRNGENGFLVQPDQESWYRALKGLVLDRHQLLHMKRAALRLVNGGSRCEDVAKMLHRELNVCTSEETEAFDSMRGIPAGTASDAASPERSLIAAAFLRGRGIEIGALHNPLPLPNGVGVRYVDRMEKEDLYAQYPELRSHNLVDIDIIDDGETLQKFPPASEDFIIANHFLEHCEDPIGAMKSFLRVVREGGVIFFAIPDMRYTFDQNRDRTSLAHLIQDHNGGKAASRFDHYREWAQIVEAHLGRHYDSQDAVRARVQVLMEQQYSIHFHCWIQEDVNELLRYCRSDLRLPFDVEFLAPLGEEILVILRRVPLSGSD